MTTEAPPISTGDVGAFFDGFAQSYDNSYDAAGWGGYVLRARLTAVLEILGDGPGTVLDAGMGPGRLCSALAARGWTVSGIDISQEMVRAARARLPSAAPRLRLGTLNQVPFGDGRFDAVAATGVLEYADHVSAAVRELARVLRPGGLAVLSLPNRRSMHGLSRGVTDPLARAVRRTVSGTATESGKRDRIPAVAAFVRSVTEAGLRIEVVRYVGALVIPAPADRMFPATVERLGRALEHRPRLQTIAATQVVVAAVRA